MLSYKPGVLLLSKQKYPRPLRHKEIISFNDLLFCREYSTVTSIMNNCIEIVWLIVSLVYAGHIEASVLQWDSHNQFKTNCSAVLIIRTLFSYTYKKKRFCFYSNVQLCHAQCVWGQNSTVQGVLLLAWTKPLKDKCNFPFSTFLTFSRCLRLVLSFV